jgi:hypothetical protein
VKQQRSSRSNRHQPAAALQQQQPSPTSSSAPAAATVTNQQQRSSRRNRHQPAAALQQEKPSPAVGSLTKPRSGEIEFVNAGSNSYVWVGGSASYPTTAPATPQAICATTSSKPDIKLWCLIQARTTEGLPVAKYLGVGSGTPSAAGGGTIW